MGRAIKCTCSYCERASYFDPAAGLSFEVLSSLKCARCGKVGAVLTLDIEAPPDARILNRLPIPEESSPAATSRL